VVRHVVSVDVALTWDELRHAGYIGIDRHVRNIARSRPAVYGADYNAWHIHVLGAWGECAIAQATERYWCDRTTPDGGAPDVGDLHVRTTQHRDGSLILHPEDRDAGAYVLVVLLALPRFRIVGWTTGAEGKQETYWRTDVRTPAYFVPPSALHPWPR